MAKLQWEITIEDLREKDFIVEETFDGIEITLKGMASEVVKCDYYKDRTLKVVLGGVEHEVNDINDFEDEDFKDEDCYYMTLWVLDKLCFVEW